jgi:NTP pyrophosphatase (non-canonical NTP hydrolase)
MNIKRGRRKMSNIIPDQLFKYFLDKFGIENQFLKTVEEMSELTKEICKSNLKKNNYDYDKIILELFDVKLMIDQILFSLKEHGYQNRIDKLWTEKYNEFIGSVK